MAATEQEVREIVRAELWEAAWRDPRFGSGEFLFTQGAITFLNPGVHRILGNDVNRIGLLVATGSAGNWRVSPYPDTSSQPMFQLVANTGLWVTIKDYGPLVTMDWYVSVPGPGGLRVGSLGKGPAVMPLNGQTVP